MKAIVFILNVFLATLLVIINFLLLPLLTLQSAYKWRVAPISFGRWFYDCPLMFNVRIFANNVIRYYKEGVIC